MLNGDRDKAMSRERPYKVVVNHEEQYSILPSSGKGPPGWRAGKHVGSKAVWIACIHIH